MAEKKPTKITVQNGEGKKLIINESSYGAVYAPAGYRPVKENKKEDPKKKK